MTRILGRQKQKLEIGPLAVYRTFDTCSRGEQATGYTGWATLFAWCPNPVRAAVGSCVRFTSEKQGVGLGWDNVLIAVRVWLNFRIPTVAFSGVDVSPAQCVRCTWVFGRSKANGVF